MVNVEDIMAVLPEEEAKDVTIRARRNWKDGEDAFIQVNVIEFGFAWRNITKLFNRQFAFRSDDAIRNRYFRLNPSLLRTKADSALHSEIAKRKPWKHAEDKIILQQVSINGCAWRTIAALLSGRSPHAIRNRYYRLVSNKF